MNFLAHAVVAASARTTEESYIDVVAGSVLPDLLGIAGIRLRRRPSREVETGIGVHHAVDVWFHSDPVFLDLAGRLRAGLRPMIGAGAARACSHVGVELLADGHIWSSVAHDLNWNKLVARCVEVVGTTQAESCAGFQDAVLPFLASDPATPYRTPELVAGRLHRRLACRPRLAFDASHVVSLADVLSVEVDNIRFAAGGWLVAGAEVATAALRDGRGSA